MIYTASNSNLKDKNRRLISVMNIGWFHLVFFSSFIFIFPFPSFCVGMCMYMYVYIYICIYIYFHPHIIIGKEKSRSLPVLRYTCISMMYTSSGSVTCGPYCRAHVHYGVDIRRTSHFFCSGLVSPLG